MTTKLHIDISHGVINIEGDPDLVREIYRDFKDQLLEGVTFAGSTVTPTPSPAAADSAGNGKAPNDGAGKPRAKRRNSAKKTNGEEGGSGVVADSPKLDKQLDTSSLPAFYDRYDARNNSEKILVFLKFMTDELIIESPNTDQFCTCFEKVDERVPKIFSQAFRNASGRRSGYIDYISSTEIRATVVGNNHFKFDLKKKTAE